MLERLHVQCLGGPHLAPEYVLHKGRVPQCLFAANNNKWKGKQEIFMRSITHSSVRWYTHLPMCKRQSREAGLRVRC